MIAGASRIAGVLANGETQDPSEANDALVILNQMIDAWGAEHLNVFTLSRNTFSLVSGTQNYTLGTGGNFNIARPSRIDYVSILSLANAAQPLEIPIQYLTDPQWQEVPVKNIQGSLPNKVYDDGGFPLRTLSYFPIPNVTTVQTVIGSWQALSQWATLVTDNTFPPGYLEAIKYNLALRIAAEWPGNISPAAIALAGSSLARIKAANITPIDMKCDSALVGSGGKGYNIFTDSQ